MSAALELDDLHLVFSVPRRRPVYALRGLSLGVPEGSVTGLLGPNGSGKTTAISCVLGLLRPQLGTVRLWGREIAPHARQHPEPSYGVLLEDTRLPPFLPVRHALELTVRLRGMTTKAGRAEVDRVVAITGIESLLPRRVSVLSKGQARRVGLANALIGDPPLLILDEPASGLDVAARVEFDQTLRRLRDGRRTVLVTTHLLGDVESTCSQLVIIRDGRALAAGPTTELVARLGAERSRSDVMVTSAEAPAVAALGLTVKPSRYEHLWLVESGLSDLDLLRALVDAGIAPRRIEPRATVLSMYLGLTAGADAE